MAAVVNQLRRNKTPQQVLTNAVAATYPNTNVGKVRIFLLGALRNERQQLLDPSFMWIAAKLSGELMLHDAQMPALSSLQRAGN